MNIGIKRFYSDNPQYAQLSNIYEEEFSPLTGAKPDVDGTYPISTVLDEFRVGYFACYKGIPIGFIVVDLSAEPFEVCEMFIQKEYRNRHFATQLVKEVFRLHSGQWQIKQLYEATKARAFWLGFLSSYTFYRETVFMDEKWGKVYRQVFETPGR